MDIKYGIVEKIMLDLLQELINLYDVSDRVSCINSHCDDVEESVTVMFYCRSANFKPIRKDLVKFKFWKADAFSDVLLSQMARTICAREFSLILLREEFYDKFAERTWKIK